MPFRWNPREQALLGRYALKWLVLAIPVGAAAGAAVALFLWVLDLATSARWATDMGDGIPWLLFLLPLAGVGICAMYDRIGKTSEGGNNLIIDQIHEPGGGVPRRMAPLVLVGTVVTHLFGGSAGREGTAVQMGGSLASGLGRLLHLSQDDTRIILMAGIAAGFGAVFGTPLTGAIFAVEVLAIGLVNFQAIIPCLIASVAGDWTTTALGIHHTHYFIGNVGQAGIAAEATQLSWLMLGKVAVAAVAFGLGSVVFAELAHGLGTIFKKAIPWRLARPAVGGMLVIALAYWIGPDYLGLGVTADPNHPEQVSILSTFKEGGAQPWSWWWKTLFTTVTLSSGFKGGEVTPLFFIGAALGNTMGVLLNAPVGLFAGLGFVALFAGATNTPLACIVMGIELFGGQPGLLSSGFVVCLAVACFFSYLISGHSGIYLSQRIGAPKCSWPELPPEASLRTARSMHPPMGAGASRMFTMVGTPRNPRHALRRLWRRSRVATGKAFAGQTTAQRKQRRGLPSSRDEAALPRCYNVSGREIGQLRIFLTPSDRREAHPFKRLFSRPLYQELIDAAKADGILNAVAHHTRYGYSGNGVIQSDASEVPNERLNLCVELIAHRDQLERFCRMHGELLQGKVIVYKHMEHWDLGTQQTLQVLDATPEELQDSDEKA